MTTNPLAPVPLPDDEAHDRPGDSAGEDVLAAYGEETSDTAGDLEDAESSAVADRRAGGAADARGESPP